MTSVGDHLSTPAVPAGVPEPRQYSAPAPETAQLNCRPVPIDAIPAGTPAIFTGLRTLPPSVWPIPTCPRTLLPQQYRMPPSRVAHVLADDRDSSPPSPSPTPASTLP